MKSKRRNKPNTILIEEKNAMVQNPKIGQGLNNIYKKDIRCLHLVSFLL